MDQKSSSPSGSPLDQLMKFFETNLVTKAPYTLPPNVKEIIVKIAPWLTLIGFVLGLPLILGVLGLGAMFAPFGMMGGGYRYYGAGMLSLLILAVSMVVEAVAIPGLFKRSLKAWTLLYYAVLLRVVADLVGFNIVSALVSGVIGLYLVFQVKSLYKNP